MSSLGVYRSLERKVSSTFAPSHRSIDRRADEESERLTVTDMLIAMLGICSKEELDEEDEEAEEEPVLAEGEEAEPELTGMLPLPCISHDLFADALDVRRGRNRRTKSCYQEQDFGSW